MWDDEKVAKQLGLSYTSSTYLRWRPAPRERKAPPSTHPSPGAGRSEKVDVKAWLKKVREERRRAKQAAAKDLRWRSLTGGLTEADVRRVNAKLSSLYLTKERPGKLALPDLTNVEIVTSTKDMRITIGKDVIFLDRDRLLVRGEHWEEGYVRSFELCSATHLFELYRLLTLWCPVPLNREGVQFREVMLVE